MTKYRGKMKKYYVENMKKYEGIHGKYDEI